MASLDVHRAFKKIATQKVTVTRYAAGSYDSYGRYSEGASSSFTIYASWQPITGRDLKDLPENRRYKNGVNVFSETEIRAGSVDNATQPDVLTYGGYDYEVKSVEKWAMAATPYYMAVVALKEQGQ